MPTNQRDGRLEAPARDKHADDSPDQDEYEEEYEEEYDELSPAEAARAALGYLSELTGKQLQGVVSLERTEDGWVVGVEVVEDRRVPSSNDVLGLYLAEIDADGSLLTYRRTKRYLRGRSDSSEAT